MKAQLQLTAQELLTISDKAHESAGNESGDSYEVELSDGQIHLIVELRYFFDSRQVKGGSYDCSATGHTVWELIPEIYNERYEVVAITATCDETDLQIPEWLSPRLEDILNDQM